QRGVKPPACQLVCCLRLSVSARGSLTPAVADVTIRTGVRLWLRVPEGSPVTRVAGGAAALGSLGPRYVEINMTGSARGAASNGGPYRDLELSRARGGVALLIAAFRRRARSGGRTR